MFQDECAVRLLPMISKTYAPLGNTPKIVCDAKNRDYVSISGAISAKGHFYFEVRQKEGFKQKGLTRFLDNLKKTVRKPILLIWDNASTHKSKIVKEYLEKQPDSKNIYLDNIPPYCPELNPIEQVWGILKKRLQNQFFKTTKELKKAVTEKLKEIQKDKKLIKQLFKNKNLKCYQFFN